MSEDQEFVYTVEMNLQYEEMMFMYSVIRKAIDDWKGGEPWKYDMLDELRQELWKMSLESQFGGGDG